MSTKLILVLFVSVVLAGAVSGWLLTRRLYDPLYGLKEFPVDAYLRDYKPLAGEDFQCRWTFAAGLWEQSDLRMTVFKPGSKGSPITVAVPKAITPDMELTPGKICSLKITVDQEGLIYAKALR